MLKEALDALADGQIILVYDGDGREEETDMVVASEHINTEHVRRLRMDAGGLLCTTVAPEHHKKLGLPWLTDVIQHAVKEHPVLAGMLPDDIRYDASKPAFGLTLNHRATFTGITDADRATTIQALAALMDELDELSTPDARARLGSEFRAPGHVTLLNGAPHGLRDRQGHTELSIELCRRAGLLPSATICEMLDPRSGRARSQKDARAYAQKEGLVFVTGQEILAACNPVRTSAS